MNEFLQFAPAIIVIVVYCMQYKVFVTPTQLAEEKAEILKLIEEARKETLKEIREYYTSKEEFKSFKEDISELKEKVDAIYNNILRNM